MDKNSNIIISRDELEALGRVVRYLWDDESKSFCELPLGDEKENHIFQSLATLGHVYDRNLIRADTARKTYTFNVTASVNFGFDVEAENLREATKKMRALINAPTDNRVEDEALLASQLGGFDLVTGDTVDVFNPEDQTQGKLPAEKLTNLA